MNNSIAMQRKSQVFAQRVPVKKSGTKYDLKSKKSSNDFDYDKIGNPMFWGSGF